MESQRIEQSIPPTNASDAIVELVGSDDYGNSKISFDTTSKKPVSKPQAAAHKKKLTKAFREVRQLRPAPYYYYIDHSQDKDEDPYAPLTPPLVVPNFVMKLHAMLIRDDLSDVIAWMPHGRSWMILDEHKFESEVLPTYYNQRSISSFVRQVNGWGFRRLLKGPERGSFYNERFLRGLPFLCKKMKRIGGAKIVDKTNIDHEPLLGKISFEHPLPNELSKSSLDHIALETVNRSVLKDGPKAKMPFVHAGETFIPRSYSSALPSNTMSSGNNSGSITIVAKKEETFSSYDNGGSPRTSSTTTSSECNEIQESSAHNKFYAASIQQQERQERLGCDLLDRQHHNPRSTNQLIRMQQLQSQYAQASTLLSQQPQQGQTYTNANNLEKMEKISNSSSGLFHSLPPSMRLFSASLEQPSFSLQGNNSLHDITQGQQQQKQFGTTSTTTASIEKFLGSVGRKLQFRHDNMAPLPFRGCLSHLSQVHPQSSSSATEIDNILSSLRGNSSRQHFLQEQQPFPTTNVLHVAAPSDPSFPPNILSSSLQRSNIFQLTRQTHQQPSTALSQESMANIFNKPVTDQFRLSLPERYLDNLTNAARPLGLVNGNNMSQFQQQLSDNSTRPIISDIHRQICHENYAQVQPPKVPLNNNTIASYLSDVAQESTTQNNNWPQQPFTNSGLFQELYTRQQTSSSQARYNPMTQKHPSSITSDMLLSLGAQMLMQQQQQQQQQQDQRQMMQQDGQSQ